jgi:hypothetical protein
MKPFMTMADQPMEAIEVLEGLVNFFLSDQVGVAEADGLTTVTVKKNDWDSFWINLKKASDALDEQDERDKEALLEIAKKGLGRPSLTTRIGRQLEKFTDHHAEDMDDFSGGGE